MLFQWRHVPISRGPEGWRKFSRNWDLCKVLFKHNFYGSYAQHYFCILQNKIEKFLKFSKLFFFCRFFFYFWKFFKNFFSNFSKKTAKIWALLRDITHFKLANTDWQISIDKSRLTNVIWQTSIDKLRLTNVDWQIKIDMCIFNQISERYYLIGNHRLALIYSLNEKIIYGIL